MPETAAPALRAGTLAETAVRHVALVGNPNVGKTTLFNALTGLRRKVGNYAGVTVERTSGPLTGAGAPGAARVELVDLPGTYSLSPRSADERVAVDALLGRLPGEPAPDVVVCVVDATNVERNLYLLTQVMEVGLPVVVALTMTDAEAEAGVSVNTLALATWLRVPVVPVVARTGAGLDTLRRAILAPPHAPDPVRWTPGPDVAAALDRLDPLLAAAEPDAPPPRRRFELLGALATDVLLDPLAARAPALRAAVEHERAALDAAGVPVQTAEMTGRYAWISPVAASVVTRTAAPGAQTRSDKIDAVVTHRVWGPLLFGLVLLVVFQAVFTWATPAMDAIEWLVAQAGTLLRAALPDGPVEDALVEGALAGVGNVLVFLPQILLLFFFLGLMEDSGYMARTAFIMDRAMRRVGLSGASVVPLLSAYACAIPGIMAARTLADERDRIVTILVVPLQGCSARLPVYVLFIGAFIPAGTVFGVVGTQSLTMVGLYVLGTAMAFVAAWVLRRFVFTGEGSAFVMELPPYRMPQPLALWHRMWERARLFLVRAGKLIFGLSLVLWVLAAYPKADAPPALAARAEAAAARAAAAPSEAADAEASLAAGAVAGWQVRQSYLGRFGHALEPVMRPLGFDWKISAGIVASFAAREVIVSALATIYSAGADADETSLSLRDALRNDRYPDGRPVFTPLVALSLLVFFVFALQCMSTLAIARRELNSWRWPVVMWAYMFALAYGFSFAVYQGGRLLGFG